MIDNTAEGAIVNIASTSSLAVDGAMGPYAVSRGGAI
jgi:hypothetical protein